MAALENKIEVNGKDNNENYEKKRFKHMLKSNP